MDFLYAISHRPVRPDGRASRLSAAGSVEGFVAGVLYALIALGFVLIFKASGVFNFAQGHHGGVCRTDACRPA
jgi:branched-chain amino acid transport system permease protein